MGRQALSWLTFDSILSPLPDVGKDEGEEEEEEEEEGMQPPLLLAPRNCLPHQGLSILDKLVKTWPVWQQLSLGQAEATRILRQEGPGVSLGCSQGGRALPTCFPARCCGLVLWGRLFEQGTGTMPDT